MEYSISKKALQRILYNEYGIEGRIEKSRGEERIIDTEKGKRVLQKTRNGPSEIFFDYSLMKHMYDKNFHQVLVYELNKEKKPYIEIEGEYYILQEYVEAHPALSCLDEIYEMAEWLGKVHRVSTNFVSSPGSRVRIDWGKWEGTIRSALLGLRKYKQLAERQKKGFDDVFLSVIDPMMEYAEKGYKLLKEYNYLEYIKERMNENTFCLKYFSPRQFVKKENQIYIQHLNRASLDLHVYDVAELIRSHCSKRDGILEINRLIKTYEKQNPISKSEKAFLVALLYMPMDFYKISKRYYERGSRYQLNGLEERLEMVISYEQKRISALKEALL